MSAVRPAGGHPSNKDSTSAASASTTAADGGGSHGGRLRRLLVARQGCNRRGDASQFAVPRRGRLRDGYLAASRAQETLAVRHHGATRRPRPLRGREFDSLQKSGVYGGWEQLLVAAAR